MSDPGATAEGFVEASAAAGNPVWRSGEVLRDIARGGTAGVVAGVLAGGLGGRLVMRIASVLHPEAAGALTENGNRIGDVTLAGSLSLMLVGLVVCTMAGAVWVVVSPWIPGRGVGRALPAAGIAIAIGTPMLIVGRNPDFVILDHDPVVLLLLVGLVGVTGLLIALLDGWLDQRLPHAATARGRPAVTYAVVAVLGAFLVLPFVALVFLAADQYQLPVRAGHMLLVVGVCTLARWGRWIQGRDDGAPRGLVFAARAALLAAVVLGVLTSVPHLAGALGVSR